MARMTTPITLDHCQALDAQDPLRGLRDQLLLFRHETRSTPQSRDAARYLLLEPPLDAAARVPYMLIAGAAIATLPAWARVELRIPSLPPGDIPGQHLTRPGSPPGNRSASS